MAANRSQKQKPSRAERRRQRAQSPSSGPAQPTTATPTTAPASSAPPSATSDASTPTPPSSDELMREMFEEVQNNPPLSPNMRGEVLRADLASVGADLPTDPTYWKYIDVPIPPVENLPYPEQPPSGEVPWSDYPRLIESYEHMTTATAAIYEYADWLKRSAQAEGDKYVEASARAVWLIMNELGPHLEQFVQVLRAEQEAEQKR